MPWLVAIRAQVTADSPRDFVGHDLGPSSPELAFGALGSCLAHSDLIQAAAQGVALDSLDVEVTGRIDQRAGEAGHEATPREPHGIAYTVHLGTGASDEAVDALHEAVERLCPVLSLLRNPQAISGPVRRDAVPDAARALSPERVLQVGDQKGGTRSVTKAAGTLNGLRCRLEWSRFPRVSMLMEAKPGHVSRASVPRPGRVP